MGHLSYSSWGNLRSCGERFRLEKIGAPRVPSYAAIGGSAFHEATEAYDSGAHHDEGIAGLWQDAFAAKMEQARSVEPDESLWYRAGKATEKTPNKEDYDFWLHAGEAWCLDYAKFTDELDWQLWELDDGRPAIEVGLLADLAGVPTRQYVDRIYVTKDGELVIVDLKTGSRVPQDHTQLGVYACGVERTLGVRPAWGVYYMARKAEHTAPANLDFYTPDLLGAQFRVAQEIWKAGLFLPNPDQHCRWCGVKRFCRAGGGDQWQQYEGMIPEW